MIFGSFGGYRPDPRSRPKSGRDPSPGRDPKFVLGHDPVGSRPRRDLSSGRAPVAKQKPFLSEIFYFILK